MEERKYHTTVQVSDQVLKLGMRCRYPSGVGEHQIRVQAVFTQRSIERRFPMEYTVVDSDTGPEIRAEALIELPYVFLSPPKRQVQVTFALWIGLREQVFDGQPFPLEKELFYERDGLSHQKGALFGLYTLGLPVMLLAQYAKNGRDMNLAKKQVNQKVYERTGFSYSPRQRNTDYFAREYAKCIKKEEEPVSNRVLFLSERPLEEHGNLRMVMDVLKQDDRIEVTEFVHTETVDRLSKPLLRECARLCAQARVIILEDFYPQLHALHLRHETKVVQLWHACGAFKTFGLSRIGKPGGAPQNTRNHRCYDLVSVSSERIRGIYAEAFGIPLRKVLPLGVPRTDLLFDYDYEERRKEVLYERYPQLRDKKVVLFAPTFRGEGNKDAYYPKEAFDVNAFMEQMDDDTALIIKHHPFVKSPASWEERYADRVLDLTGKDSINDLMLISNLLITDYSSSIFEGALLDLPMLFYAFDEEEYTADRDFYENYRQFVPGPVETRFGPLAAHAARLLREAQPVEYVAFLKDYLSALDGHSTQRVCSYITDRFLF